MARTLSPPQIVGWTEGLADVAAEIMFENADNIRRDWPKLVRQGVKWL